MAERRQSLPEPCTSQGARVAGARYAGRYPGNAIVMRHSGRRDARWWLVAAVELAEAHRLYVEALAVMPMDSNEALAVWFDGGAIRFGEVLQAKQARA